MTLLDSHLRRLKIEYEIFFSNPTKRPPTDLEWKVLALLRKFSDGGRMSFSQRFRYNEIAQRYAIYSDLWRKKGRIREEGYRRPQDALLSVQGVREAAHKPEHKAYGVGHAVTESAPGVSAAAAALAQEKQPFTVECSDTKKERDQVEKLYHALAQAKRKSGKGVGDLESFTTFVQKKTDQIRKQYGCQAVEFSVDISDGDVKLKAKAKT